MSTNNSIPFLDLIGPHQDLNEELIAVLQTALATAGFIGGPMVETFEREFANYCETAFCAGVSSGTDALRFILIAAGVKAGDIVVTVPNTFIATVEAISQAGAQPVFVDVDQRTYNLDPERLREYLDNSCDRDDSTGALIDRKLRKRVAAIVPVHLYGQIADMDGIIELAGRYGLTVIEDACQAHGAEYYSPKRGQWLKAGSIGKAAAFSFYPGKNLGACGEGGAVTTNDADLASCVRMLRDHGQARKYYHDVEGYNGRLDAIQAGFLRVKLQHLPHWNEQRRQCATRYREMLQPVGGVGLPYAPSWAKGVYHLFVVRVGRRAEVQRYLAERNIGTGIHYPVPLHLQKAYSGLGYREGDFPVSEEAALEILSLPMYPGLSQDQQQCVCDRLEEFVDQDRLVALRAT